MLDSITKNVNYEALAKEQKKNLLEESPAMQQEIAKSLATMYNLDEMDTLLDDPKCAQCGVLATQRCSRCKNEWYCGRACQVKSWKIHKQVCDILAPAKVVELQQ
jgi:hypothetical protein